MGGTIAITIRISPERTYRGSCWTNILPEGLCAAPFYIDADTSRRHTAEWLDRLLANRAADPGLEDMWGGHDMLAPLSYGLVVVDYVTSTLVSMQGYCSLDEMYLPGRTDEAKAEKWEALEKAGLLGPPERDYPPAWKAASIKTPFTHVMVGDSCHIDTTLQAWCEQNFGLSDRERVMWATWFKDRDE
jgi:hypothetical protein